MSANSLSVPFPIFNDIDGDPLDAGYIHIGTANLDPVTNAISVYFDEALTIPAAQPIRTLNGFPSNSGAPARLYISADDYSITVKNKNGSQVYTSPVSTLAIASGAVNYTQGGTGSTQRTLTSKLQEMVSVKDFGAVGDGVTDDTAAIQAALDSLTEGQTLVFNIPKAYLGAGISRTDIPERVTVDFNGCHVTAHSSVSTMFSFTGVNTSRGNRTLAAPNYTSPVSPPSATVYVRGVRKFELTDASGIQTGDWVQFYSPRKFDINGTKQTYEVNRVWDVDGNTVYLDGESLVAFEQGDTLEVRALSEGFTVKNGYIDQQGVNGEGVVVAGFNRPKIEKMMFVDPYRYGLYVRYCCEDQVVNCNVRSAGTPTSPVAGYSGDYGYGFIHARNCFSRVDNCVGSDGWHSFEAADGQRDITYTSSIAIADGHGFSTHQNCVSAIYINCQAKARLPMIMRCRYPKILGGDYTKTTADATFSFGNAWEVVVKGISYKCDRDVNSEGNFYNLSMANNSDYTDEPQDFISRMIFQDNYVNCKAGRFYVSVSDATNECYIQNNIFNIIKGTIYFSAINKVLIKNNSFNYIQENSDDGVSPGGSIPFVSVGTSGTANTDAVLFDGNIVSVLSSGASNADLFNYNCAGSAKVTVSNNTFYAMSGARYAIRAYSSGNDLHMYGNIFTSPNSAVNSFSRILSGTININAINNIYPNYITYNLAYNIGYGGTVVEATNEIFLGKKTTMFSNMPTSTTGLPAGSLWNNAGVVNIV